MARRRAAGQPRIRPGWWTLALIMGVVGVVALTTVLFKGTFTSYVPVTLTSDRAGLVMESGGKVKLRGVQVGKVADISSGSDAVSLKLDIDPDQVQFIPANVDARIRATTAFGAKYVDLIYPSDPSSRRLQAGAVIRSQNVSSEVNTVFQNLVGVLNQIDPAKLNAVLSALADGLRGQGPVIGEAITDANQVLLAVNPRSETIRADYQAFKGFNDTYSAAATDILSVLDAASTTSTTITKNAKSLDSLLLSTIGFSRSGIDLLAPNKDNLIRAINVAEPTTALLMKYNPELTCMLVGGKFTLDNGLVDANGGANGYSQILDVSLLFGDDPYRYPDNLPIIGAKGGPGGKPGCGSLPDVAKNWPVRYTVTNTGFGTGMDVRPNPGIGFPGYANYLPVTRAVPEPPSIRYPGGPAPGPIPYPGAPPYGAQLYAPDGTPLYPGLPPAPPPGAPRDPGPPPPGTEPFVVANPGLAPTPTPPLPLEAAPSP
jgi:phospholipid/cholesterol/gamma-HCH transport system substrate-binding protein